MTQTDAAKPDQPKPDEPKPDESQGVKRAEGELAHAYERIKTAHDDLARLDRLVSGMERDGDHPSIRQKATAAKPDNAAASETPAPQTTSENEAPRPGERRSRPMLLALAGFLLALGFGAAFAARYGNPATAIMARWAPPVPIAHNEASEAGSPTKLLMAQAADATEQPSPPVAPGQKETKDVPPADAASADRTSADLAQSLKTITHDLASINEKLDQLKSSYDQTLREHADTLQQLKTTQEQNARDKASMDAQIQAMQAQLTALAAKSTSQSQPQAPKKQNDAAAPRPRQSVAASSRPRRPPPLWRPRAYMDDSPWDEPYW
jgi:hypothetical protein